MMHAIAIETEIGTIHRRSAIFLDSVEYPSGTSVLVLEGDIGGYACRPVRHEGRFDYRLRFEGVMAHRIIELDSFDSGGLDESIDYASFYELVESTWLVRNRSRAHRHFVLCTYDDVLELLATGYELTLTHRPEPE